MASPIDSLIRAATSEDAMGIARVHVETWRDAYRGVVADRYLAAIRVEERVAAWLEWLSTESGQERPLIFVAEESAEIVGFISGGTTRRPALPFDAELYALYVEPARQRRRLGRRLTRALVDELIDRKYRGLLVGVLEGNESGRRFYESMGGRRVDVQSVVIGGDAYSEVFYGWPAIQDVAA